MAQITHFQGFVSSDTAPWWGLGSTVSFATNAWVVSRAGGTVTFLSSSGFSTPRFPSDVPVGTVDGLELRVNGQLVASITGLGGLGMTPADIGNNPTGVLAGADTFTGSVGTDTFSGGAGLDRLDGGDGADSLSGGSSGMDTLNGGEGNDTLTGYYGGLANGGGGDDKVTLFGGEAFGGAGADRIEGYNAYLHGDDGADTITASANQSMLVEGGAGDDLINVTYAGGASTVDGGAGVDTVVLSYSGTVTATGQVGNIKLIDVETVSFTTAGSLDVSALSAGVRVTAGTQARAAIGTAVVGTSFADTISGGDGADTLAGGAGDDILDGGSPGWGREVVGTGGIPSSTIVYTPPRFDLADYSRATRGVTVDLNVAGAQDTGDGRDTLIGFEGVIGSAFDDVLVGAPGDRNWGEIGDDRQYAATRLYGGGGNDLLIGTTASQPGSLGDDTLVGGSGDDTIEGRSGDDVLDGGTGANVLTGGLGADKFLIARDGQADRIDFNAAQGDTILLTEPSGAISPWSNGLLIWDQRTGTLSFDIDGDGGGFAPEAVATFAAGQAITASNLAAGFHPAAIRTIAADGSVSNVALDWATHGTAGADHMTGTDANDILDAGAGDDWLDGRGGDDQLIGGAGADKFILRLDGSTDNLVDFNTAQGDHLLLLANETTIADGSRALLTLTTNGVLSWDPDSDAGSAAATTIGVMAGSTVLMKSNFAAGFQPSAFRMLAANGSHDDYVYDWGSQSFDWTKTSFTSTGALSEYDVHFDDGSRSIRAIDVFNQAPDWGTVVSEYDAQNRLFAYSVYHDDGSRTLWLYDTANTKTWSRVLEEYDSLSRLTQQSAANDDGTAWERHIDAADTQPWAYYIDNYAGGQLLNHTLYNANGTVFVG